MALRPRQTIRDKYRIHDLIGEGGMARVWLAEEITFGSRQVAIKEPRDDLFPEDMQELRRRYRREVRICAALEDAGTPNVVRALTAEPYEDELLVVMAYMPGGDLGELLREYPDGLPIEQAVTIALQVLEALHRAHEHPLEIVHRDVKPGNVLFDAEGIAHLGDFGLAQLAGASGRSQLQGGHHPGTPMYMAPEQEREQRSLTPAADLYALGCVLFEMLTGQRYKRVRPGTKPSDVHDAVPAWLDEVVVRALQEDQWERWTSAEEMAAALREGQVQAERVRILTTMRERAEAALAAGRWQQAQEAADEWLNLEPEASRPTEILTQVQRGQRREELTGAAEAALTQQAWEELRSAVSELQGIDAEAAEPFAEALAAHEREERERQQRLAEWYAEAERCVADDPERALELVAKVEAKEANYADLAELAETARQVQQAREQEAAEQWSDAAQAYRQALEQTQGEAPWRSAVEEGLQRSEQEAHWAQLYEEAQAALSQSDWHAAIEILERLLAAAPDYRDAGDLLERAHGEQRREELTQAARSALEAQDWDRLQDVLGDLQTVDAEAAEPFAAALAAHEREERVRRTPAGLVIVGSREELQNLDPLPERILWEPDGAEMVLVPAGPFLMGTPEESSDGYSDESPQREVTLDAYYIDRTPVTNAEYARFLAATPEHAVPYNDADWAKPYNWDRERRTPPAGKEDHPVVLVTWHDAVAYCRWAGKRLPTEAEWEKAARGTDGRRYPWGEEWEKGKYCNTKEAGIGETTPVGKYPQGASPYGALDVAGNVWEWCADWYDSDYYAQAPTRNPQGPESGNRRVLRGGSWVDDRDWARCACRRGDYPNYHGGDVGFRCCAAATSSL